MDPRKEQRASPRISAPVRACLIGSDGTRSEVPVRDLGMGGLFVFTPYLIAQVGDRRELEIGTPDGSYFLRIEAEATRATASAESNQLVGLGFQFVDVTSEQNARLSELLSRLLKGSGGDKRAYPRISHQAEVTLSAGLEVKCILRDLGLGGAGLWVDTPLAVGQAVVLHLDGAAATSALSIGGKVASTRWPKHDEPYGQAGIQFDELDDATRKKLVTLLDKVLRG